MKNKIALIIIFLILLSGCATTKTNFSYVPALKKQALSSRSAPAKISKESEENLTKKGYLKIGDVSSVDTVKTCWGDGCSNFSCTSELPHKDFTKEVLEKAASHGGDLVILEKDSVPYIEETSKEKCTRTRVAGSHFEQQCSGGYGNVPRVCRNVEILRYECASWRTEYGKKCTFASAGTVWRYDPDLIKRIAEGAKEQIRRTAEEAKEQKKRAAEKAKALEIAMLKYKADPYGLAVVKSGKKFGYQDKDARMIIQPQFDAAGAFYEGLARVTSGKKDGYIDMSGTITIQPQFDYGGMFSEELARVRIGEVFKKNMGYIDITGTVVIKPQFDAAGNFSDGFAFVGSGTIGQMKWGCIDRSGKLVIDFKFDDAKVFSEGLAAVAVGPTFTSDRWGYINKTGGWVIRPSFYDAGEFSDGLAPVSQGTILAQKWGYINKDGQFVIKAQFAGALPFSEGLAAVKVDGKFGFIDKKGNFVIKPQFYDAMKFSHGYARVQVDGRWRFIDRSGKSVLDESFDVGRLVSY